MLSLRRIHHHFLPHFIVQEDLASAFGGHDKIHHRAHALSLWSLSVYLQVLVVFSVFLYTINLKAPQILGAVSFSADQIISLTNQKRAENGLPVLSYNPLLAQAASAKAANMLAENYWAHNSPSGKTPWSFISAAGYRYIFAGENLARDFDDPGAVVSAWMNSPTHRDNLLDSDFVEIGVAVVWGNLTGREGTLVVQEFGAGVSSRASTNSTAVNTVAGTVSNPATPKPSVVASPTQEPSPLAVVVNQVDESDRQEFQPVSEQAQAVVLASRQFSVAKSASLVLVVFVFLLFFAEVLFTLKHEKLTLRPGVLAHLLLLAFILFALWYAVGGAVL